MRQAPAYFLIELAPTVWQAYLSNRKNFTLFATRHPSFTKLSQASENTKTQDLLFYKNFGSFQFLSLPPADLFIAKNYLKMFELSVNFPRYSRNRLLLHFQIWFIARFSIEHIAAIFQKTTRFSILCKIMNCRILSWVITLFLPIFLEHLTVNYTAPTVKPLTFWCACCSTLPLSHLSVSFPSASETLWLELHPRPRLSTQPSRHMVASILVTVLARLSWCLSSNSTLIQCRQSLVKFALSIATFHLLNASTNLDSQPR